METRKRFASLALRGKQRVCCPVVVGPFPFLTRQAGHAPPTEPPSTSSRNFVDVRSADQRSKTLEADSVGSSFSCFIRLLSCFVSASLASHQNPAWQIYTWASASRSRFFSQLPLSLTRRSLPLPLDPHADRATTAGAGGHLNLCFAT